MANEAMAQLTICAHAVVSRSAALGNSRESGWRSPVPKFSFEFGDGKPTVVDLANSEAAWHELTHTISIMLKDRSRSLPDDVKWNASVSDQNGKLLHRARIEIIRARSTTP